MELGLHRPRDCNVRFVGVQIDRAKKADVFVRPLSRVDHFREKTGVVVRLSVMDHRVHEEAWLAIWVLVLTIISLKDSICLL